MIAVPEMPELVAQHECQFVLGLDLLEQTLGNDDQPARQRHGVGLFRVIDLDTKLVRRIRPSAQQGGRPAAAFRADARRRRNGHQVFGQPVGEQLCLGFRRHEIQYDLNQEDQRQRDDDEDGCQPDDQRAGLDQWVNVADVDAFPRFSRDEFHFGTNITGVLNANRLANLTAVPKASISTPAVPLPSRVELASRDVSRRTLNTAS